MGIGEIDDLLRGVELGIDTFDCAMPTRIGRHGMAVIPDPAQRWRVDLAKGRYRGADEPILEGCPCPACARGYSRAYLHYLLKGRESTASRLLTIHNLAYLQMLMAALREAIAEGRLAERVTAAARAGAGAVGRLVARVVLDQALDLVDRVLHVAVDVLAQLDGLARVVLHQLVGRGRR